MKQKIWLIIAIISFFLLILSLNDSFINIIIKFMINNFASGRSDFKIISFFVYFILCSLILYFNKNIKVKYSKTVYIFSITTLFVIGFISQTYIYEKFDLNYTQFHTSVYEGRMSSDQLTHNHVSKAILGKITNLINPSLNYKYDAGLFYSEYIPNKILIMGAFFLIIAIIFSFINLINVKLDKENNNYNNLFLFIYVIASYSTLKNILDGGILNPETISWLIILIITLYVNDFKKYFLLIITTGIGFYFLQVPFNFTKEYSNIIPFSINYLSHFLFFGFIIGTYYFIKNKKWIKFIAMSTIFIIFVNLISIYIPTSYYNYTLDVLNSINKKIPVDNEIYVFYYNTNSKNNCKEIIYQQPDFKICKNRNTETTYRELLNKNTNIPPVNHPITIINFDCNENSNYQTTKYFLLVEGNVPKNINTSFMDINFQKYYDIKFKYPLYSYSINAKGCIPNFENTVARIINNNGVKAYIILNEITSID